MKGAQGMDGLAALRADARARFERLEWPAREGDEWKRSGLDPRDLSSFEPAPSRGGACREPEGFPGGAALPSLPLSGAPAPGIAARLRFSGGECVELWVDATLLDRGLRVLSLESLDGAALSFLRSSFEAARDRVAVWHFSELGPGAWIHLPRGLQVEGSILVDFELPLAGSVSSPQLLVTMEEGSAARIVSWIGGDPGREAGPGLVNARSDVRLAAGARLELFEGSRLEGASMAFREAEFSLGEGSRLHRIEAGTGGRHARTRTRCTLAGRGAEAILNGAFFCGEGETVFMDSAQLHLVPGAKSRATYKSVADSGGRSVYQGLIEVAPGAAGTDAYLSNRNLLLGGASRADSIPTLKIANDDVRCSHGSATGRVSNEELFYLETRGFPRREARELIVEGFVAEVLGSAREEDSAALLAALKRRLSAGG